MKLKLLKNVKHYNNDIIISKNGQIRFKNHFVTDWNIEKGDKIEIGINEDEIIKKSLFLIKSDNGFKVQNGGGQFFISAKSALDQIGFKMPSILSFEPFDECGYVGMKLILKD